MVDWIETYITVIGAGISIGVLITSFGTLILLIINAGFIWRYVKQTKRLADETAVIARASRAEFEPNVQVVFKERVERIGYQNRRLISGLIINAEEKLVIDIEFNNLSRNISDFWLEFSKPSTDVITCTGSIKLNPSIWNEYSGQPIVLKPKETSPAKLFIDLNSDFNKAGMDVGNYGILKGSLISISYIIVYRNRKEPFYEKVAIEIKDIVTLQTSEKFLIGEWSNVKREYYEEIPDAENPKEPP